MDHFSNLIVVKLYCLKERKINEKEAIDCRFIFKSKPIRYRSNGFDKLIIVFFMIGVHHPIGGWYILVPNMCSKINYDDFI